MQGEDRLPSWDEMESLARISAESKFKANIARDNLERFIADCVKRAYTDQRLWPNAKSPTQSYIEHVVRVSGNNPEEEEKIKELQTIYREYLREYEEARNLLNNLKDQISVFQTLSANKRTGL